MRSDGSSKHCTNERLLAYLDAELPEVELRTVKAHVSRCWECRARMLKLDKSAQRFARAFVAQEFPGSGKQVEARDRFLKKVEQVEAMSLRRPEFRMTPRLSLRFAVGMALAVAPCLASLTVTPLRTFFADFPDLIWPPTAEETLDRAVQDRVDPCGRTVAGCGRRRGGDLGVGGLVQQPPAAGAVGPRAAGGVRGDLRARSRRLQEGGLCHVIQPPGNPGRFSVRVMTVEEAAQNLSSALEELDQRICRSTGASQQRVSAPRQKQTRLSLAWFGED